jgi:glycosyltransferase involved in cell wall biosynthesis
MRNLFSVLISVYEKDSGEYLSLALESIIFQTLPPNEIVIVKDGPLNSDLDFILTDFVEKYSSEINIKVISILENIGLGGALKIGVTNCSNNYIVRMDSDDISMKFRFEKLINFISCNPQYAIVGSGAEEFKNIPGDLNRFRILPEAGKALLKFSKYRNPINHPSIVFNKIKILEVGNYNADILYFEDFSLVIRLLKNDALIYNLKEPLIYFRVGDDNQSIKRRHGFKYLWQELKFVKLCLSIGHLNYFQSIFYIMIKGPIRLLPTKLLARIYNQYLRS